MALKFTNKRERVEFGEDDFVEVRGLALPDISQLVETHTAPVVELYDKFSGRAGAGFDAEDTTQLAIEVLQKFPAIVAHVIALAADVPDRFEEVAKLPPDVQVAALEKIGKLTFAMQGGLGNFVETVSRMATGASGLSAKLNAPRA